MCAWWQSQDTSGSRLLSPVASPQCDLPPSTDVSIAGRALLVNGDPYEVRGLAYSPLLGYEARMVAPPDIFTQRHAARWSLDLHHLAALGANTLRLYNWDPAEHEHDIAFLDACAAVGLRVILPISNYFLDHPDMVKRIVYRVASHRSLLMWAVSNEAAGTTPPASPKAREAFAKVARLTAEVRKAEKLVNTWHPISVPLTCDVEAMLELTKVGAVVDVDAFNCYWATDQTFPVDFYAQLAAASSRPALLSEFGIDALDNIAGTVDEDVQANHLVAEWRSLVSADGSGGATIGAVVFEWLDEPWKAVKSAELGGACEPNRGGIRAGWGPNALPDQCANEAFFGISELLPNGSLHLKRAYFALRREWAGAGRECALGPMAARDSEVSVADSVFLRYATGGLGVASLLLVACVITALRHFRLRPNTLHDEQRELADQADCDTQEDDGEPELKSSRK
eukprot:CAMPEP_0183346696 /NCGR_PEP_ID=MMETSP0164_2-20130417/11732_1 /TAXON_ID=221442 /ORGANISM="Coccolithus pelagicus ssp braarudi, Strain PLY182g" /LENGTH=453 /DNA_ID=CAMNT_0025518011 /DNA_START=54 /DNA_END=1415 /DNA_ORIENTATION=-